jgi:hypothetical protein
LESRASQSLCYSLFLCLFLCLSRTHARTHTRTHARTHKHTYLHRSNWKTGSVINLLTYGSLGRIEVSSHLFLIHEPGEHPQHATETRCQVLRSVVCNDIQRFIRHALQHATCIRHVCNVQTLNLQCQETSSASQSHRVEG